MDTIIYLATALLAVIWSVQIYLNWHHKAGLAEDSGWRFTDRSYRLGKSALYKAGHYRADYHRLPYPALLGCNADNRQGQAH
jgi:hypothetical protein